MKTKMGRNIQQTYMLVFHVNVSGRSAGFEVIQSDSVDNEMAFLTPECGGL